MRTPLRGTMLALALASVTPLAAFDAYDIQTLNDNTPGSTRNELTHGSEQWHDLAALPGPKADEDWYRLVQRPYSSYEVTVDAVSGDIPTRGFQLALVAADGVTVLQVATASALTNRSLRVSNQTDATISDQFIVVRGAACAAACGSDDVYRIRAFETTVAVARFLNSGSGTTVLLLQNPAASSVTGTAHFWSANGTLLAAQPFTLGAHQMLVLQTASIVPNQAGHITIAHTARYGELSGKATTLEPATGFVFESAVTHLPR
ncbi:MAG: hypothetical protein R2712_16260 [Vicinamibacterales bacterium]